MKASIAVEFLFTLNTEILEHLLKEFKAESGIDLAGDNLAMQRLREASTQISAARAREEMAATLHDGVLQTLAVIQRRSDDVELVAAPGLVNRPQDVTPNTAVAINTDLDRHNSSPL